MADWVSASQLNQWTYCSRQYWLGQVVGLRPDHGGARRMRIGTRKHRRHGLRAGRARLLDRVATALLLLASVGVGWLVLVGLQPLDGLPFTPQPWALATIAGIALIAMLTRWTARGHHRATGLPDHLAILASDTGQKRVETLRDFRRGLVGKPDYVLRKRRLFGDRLIPAEVKPSRRSNRLLPGDELQLIAYLLLMRAKYGRRAASYGYVVYATRTFRVDLDRQRRRWCEKAIRAVRRARRARSVHRNHDSRGRCAQCAFRAGCGEALV